MSVLVLRALGIGDLATAVPALRGLRGARPTEEIMLAAPGWLAPLADLTGAVDRVVPVDSLRVRTVPVAPPQLAVNLHGRGPQSHRLLARLRPAELMAYANPAAGFLDGPRWEQDEHEVHRWCRLLAWYGIAAHPTDLDLHTPVRRGDPMGATIVHPGSKDPARRWSPRGFAEVARALSASGHHVVVTGGPGERPVATLVTRLAGLPDSANLAGCTDLGELAALVADARLLVSGDTGIAHLATGYGTPSVVLFGPVPPAWWGPPPGRPWHQVLWHGEHAGRPGASTATGAHPALAAVTVDEVLEAVDRALAAGDEQVAQLAAPGRDEPVGYRHAATP
ncbi:MAG TPA: glycosyltransferase family 9 protein [Micromonosporaceae bacterium]